MLCSLPLDLETEILSRVPATTLSQWRTLCKRWYGISKDPRFIKENLVKGKAATQVVLQKGCTVYSVNIHPHGVNNNFESFLEFTGNIKTLKDKETKIVKIEEMSYCGGLFLCTTHEDYSLVLWNPCTAQTRWIKSDKPSSVDDKYFLGYGDNSYKILRISNFNKKRWEGKVFEFGIYDMKSESWKVLDDVTVGCDYISPLGVSLNGNTYWVATNEDPYATFVLKFNFTTERFGRMSLLFKSADDDETLVLSVVGEEKLALFHQRYLTLRMEIWVSNTVIDDAKDLSWRSFLKVNLNRLFRRPWMTGILSFLVDEENKFVVFSDTDIEERRKIRICILGEKKYQQVYKDTTLESRGCAHLVNYTPSLVQITGKAK